MKQVLLRLNYTTKDDGKKKMRMIVSKQIGIINSKKEKRSVL